MAAEVLSRQGIPVDLYDAMPSVGRKFLMAGRGGLNLTHSEPRDAFLSRYGSRRPELEPLLAAFGPDALRDWAHGLGVDTFVGSSGRVFPTDMKAAPLLRAWLHRLRESGVRFHVRHRWLGWETEGRLRFDTPAGEKAVDAGASVLALGGGSQAKLGSDGAWVPLLEGYGAVVAPLRPANCGFDVGWSDHFRERFAGEPLKSVAIHFVGETRRGECLVTGQGVEGSLIYALSAPLRDAIETQGSATLLLDLMPDRTPERIAEALARPRGSRSLSSHLQGRLGLKGVKAGLLRECLAKEAFADPAKLAFAIKALPIKLLAPRPLDEAISTAGGVAFEALDDHLMLRNRPGVFCAGEMLDWEAPTGGYLLTACFASGHAAGQAAAGYLRRYDAAQRFFHSLSAGEAASRTRTASP
ncbi:MAG: TIGR03862 family flavoprotein [Gammaproteobacteria bacterium]|nr:TIGR03862 family flavoprotein [Gammaproteobacteria bacterium]MBU1654443.1 TIGR03862 family flavoprotein [Gammaproteobacteria bacterium]MBU1960693.1 TIGR03862 family flavoprotein [Gammaproteobacteria bacterium]